jgi:hypothetical protein
VLLRTVRVPHYVSGKALLLNPRACKVAVRGSTNEQNAGGRREINFPTTACHGQNVWNVAIFRAA